MNRSFQLTSSTSFGEYVFFRVWRWNGPKREDKHAIYVQLILSKRKGLQIRACPGQTTQNPRICDKAQRPAKGGGKQDLGWFGRLTGSAEPPLVPFAPIFGSKISHAQATVVEVELVPRDPWNRI
jgi:hypothetical protein